MSHDSYTAPERSNAVTTGLWYPCTIPAWSPKVGDMGKYIKAPTGWANDHQAPLVSWHRALEICETSASNPFPHQPGPCTIYIFSPKPGKKTASWQGLGDIIVDFLTYSQPRFLQIFEVHPRLSLDIPSPVILLTHLDEAISVLTDRPGNGKQELSLQVKWQSRIKTRAVPNACFNKIASTSP